MDSFLLNNNKSGSVKITITPCQPKTLTHLPKRPPVDIAFSDLMYTVSEGRKKKQKTILKSVSGRLRAGELTAIMGPSGAGKSTLLNILTGYKTSGMQGSITINGFERNLSQFRKLSCYIMQDNQLHGNLTVEEAMKVATSLKLSSDLSKRDKEEVIQEILETLGLQDHKKTLTSNLSGGQKKRLSIALELVNNPPIMFFDEPTSGLDSSSCFQCISLLKSLSRGGRTIICTIHQPSARLFEMFDHLYTLAEGQCVYQGSIQQLVPFLGTLGLVCPSYHNPASFLIEVACGEYGDNVKKLVAAIQNGKYDIQNNKPFPTQEQLNNDDEKVPNGETNTGNNTNTLMNTGKNVDVLKNLKSLAKEKDEFTEKNLNDDLVNTVEDEIKNYMNHAKVQSTETKKINNSIETSKASETKISNAVDDEIKNFLKNAPPEHAEDRAPVVIEMVDTLPEKKDKKSKKSKAKKALLQEENCGNRRYAISEWRQMWIVLKRALLFSRRDWTLMYLRLFAHILVGFLIGALYYDIGDDGAKVLSNLGFLFFNMLFLMYTSMTITILSFPLEMPVLVKEHFNRWYSLRAYYLAITISDLPFQAIFCVMYASIVYYLTGQPLEGFRFGMFISACLLISFVAQSVGLVVGAAMNVQNGVFLAPVMSVPFLLFSGFFVSFDAIPVYLRWITYLSYIRYGFEGTAIATYKYNRSRLHCHQEYCHFKNPNITLQELDMVDSRFEVDIIALIIIFLVLRIAAFIFLRYKLISVR